MSRSVAEITQEALQLPQKDQYKLARAILESAETHYDSGVTMAWDEEVERRIAAIDSGTAKGLPFSQALREIDDRLKRQ
jgi:putative addiction module component (TIGR02574 family)